MPQEQQAKRVNPSPGLLQRIFGTSEMTPEMLEGIDIARQEMPEMGEVESYGPISRLFMGGANAYVSPGKKIYMNPSTLLGHNPQEIADTLTHEQEHVKQMNNRGTNRFSEVLGNSIFGRGLNKAEPYHRNPDEMGAFQAEEKRRKKTGRAGSTAMPSFSTGNWNTPRDIRLKSNEEQAAIAERQRKLLGGGR